MTTHEQAVEMAHAEAGSWANSIDVEQVVRAYLEARADMDGDTQAVCAAGLLCDFGEEHFGEEQ